MKKFISYPSAFLLDEKGKTIKKLLWGDWAEELDQNTPGMSHIKCRNATGWVKTDNLQPNQLLELNFVDVGQGDGCFIVTPDDKFILFDAGEEANMEHFLNWRFNLRNNDIKPAIQYLFLSHSDSDHYGGLRNIIDNERYSIGTIFHNGLIERAGPDPIGPSLKLDRKTYFTGVAETMDELKQLLERPVNRGRSKFANLMFDALNSGRVSDIRMLAKGKEVPGYSQNDAIYLESFGPVCKNDADTGHENWLLRLGNESVTKNGHSVVVRLHFGNVSILLGGDLNKEAERFLLKTYTGIEADDLSRRDEMVKKAREFFMADIAKACHHGSNEFLDAFLACILPMVTIISSGDNETHVHPRPETLGTIGKNSRGDRPLIFITELARSSISKVSLTDTDIEKLQILNNQIKDPANAANKAELEKQKNKLLASIERIVAVYGTIIVRTDGQKLMIAMKKERKGAGFISFCFRMDPSGEWVWE